MQSQIETIQALQDDMGSMWIGDVASCFQGIKQVLYLRIKLRNLKYELKLKIYRLGGCSIGISQQEFFGR